MWLSSLVMAIKCSARWKDDRVLSSLCTGEGHGTKSSVRMLRLLARIGHRLPVPAGAGCEMPRLIYHKDGQSMREMETAINKWSTYKKYFKNAICQRINIYCLYCPSRFESSALHSLNRTVY